MKRVLVLLLALALLALPACGDQDFAASFSEVEQSEAEAGAGINVDNIGWVILFGGDSFSGKNVTLKGDDLEQFKETLAPMTFSREAELEDFIGCSSSMSMTVFDLDGRELGDFSLVGEDSIKMDGWLYAIQGGSFDREWLKDRLRALPESSYDETTPWIDFRYPWAEEEPGLQVDICQEQADPHRYVTITDPALAGEIRDKINSMEYRAIGEYYEGGEYPFYINEVFHDENEYMPPAVKIVSADTIDYCSSGLYRTVGGEFDLERLADLCDPEGSYAGREGVYHWNEAEGFPEELLPEPTPEPTLDPEVWDVMQNPPEELVFDFQDPAWILMSWNDGKLTALLDDDLADVTAEVNSLRFERREACTIDSYVMHGEGYTAPYHGNPIATLTWYDEGGHVIDEIGVRGGYGWIDYHGWYYQAREEGVHADPLSELNKKLPQADWMYITPLIAGRDLSGADSVILSSNRDMDWSVVVTDKDLLKRLAEGFQDREFRAVEDPEDAGEEYWNAAKYTVEWEAHGNHIYTYFVIDENTVSVGGGHYIAADASHPIDMELLDQLADSNGKYTDKPGVTWYDYWQ